MTNTLWLKNVCMIMHRVPRENKKNELIKLLAHGGVDDGDALSLATCKRSEKGATLGRAILPARLRTA